MLSTPHPFLLSAWRAYLCKTCYTIPRASNQLGFPCNRQVPSGSTLQPSVALAIPVSIHRIIVAVVGSFKSLLLCCWLLLLTPPSYAPPANLSTLLSFSSFPISHKSFDRPTVHLHTLALLLSCFLSSFRFSIHSVTSSPHIQITRGRQTCQPPIA